MKHLSILLLVLPLITPSSMLSQRDLTAFMNEYYKDRQQRMLVSDYGGATGSAYLFDDFRKGIVHMKSQKIYEMPLRFNLYENKFEFKVDSAIYVVQNPAEIVKIDLNGETYVYFQLNNRYMFVELMVSGKATLIVKKDVILIDGAKPEAYVEPKPPYFERRKDVFYIVKDNNTYIVKNKKSVIDILNDKKKEISEYIKSEKIKPNKKEQLKKVIEYYNSLYNEQSFNTKL